MRDMRHVSRELGAAFVIYFRARSISGENAPSRVKSIHGDAGLTFQTSNAHGLLARSSRDMVPLR